jgi:hypothetical protein
VISRMYFVRQEMLLQARIALVRAYWLADPWMYEESEAMGLGYYGA